MPGMVGAQVEPWPRIGQRVHLLSCPGGGNQIGTVIEYGRNPTSVARYCDAADVRSATNAWERHGA